MANQLARYSSSYWGEKPPAPYYVGAVICLLFVIGLIFAEKKHVIWLSITAVLGILLSLGDSFSSFNYFMFDYFPGYNKFRSVTFAIIITFIAFNLLGFIGLEKLISSEWNKQTQKKFYMAIGSLGGLCLLIILFAGVASFLKPGEEQLPVWFTSALADDREGLMRGDALRTLIFIILTSAAIFIYSKNKISVALLGVILTALVLIDTTVIDKRHFGEANYKRKSDKSFIQPTEADQQISKDKSIFRVYNLKGDAMSEARTSFHHMSLGGYHGAKMRRYQDFYTNCIEKQRSELISSIQQGNMDFNSYDAINMLNAKYLTFGPGKTDFIINDAAFGNAWLVKSIKTANNPDDELSVTCSSDLNNTAVIDASKFEIKSPNVSDSGSVELVEYQPNKLTYKAKTSANSLIVFSEIYYPLGWVATIDGKEQEIIRANFILRALEVPSGNHDIVFEFKPRAYAVGNTITLLSCIVLLLLVIGSIGYTLKTSLSQSSETGE